MLHKFLKIMLCLVVIFLFTVSTKPTLSTRAEQTAVINTAVLNVREGPGLSYNVRAQVKKGETYTIIDRKNDWVKLQLPSTNGWVASWLVQEGVSENKSNTSSTEKVVSTVNGLRLRTGPGTSFQIIGSLNKGQEASLIEKNENWTKVSFNNQKGWVSSQYVSSVKGSSAPSTTNKSKKTGEVSATVLNVRNTPGLQGKIIGKLTDGAKVTVVSERENWLEINFENGKAWVHRDFITGLSSSSEDQETEAPSNQAPESNRSSDLAIVTASSLNVRNNGSLSGKVIGSLKKGDQVTIEEEVNKWCKVLLPDGSKGWVAGWYLEAQEKQAPTNSNDEAASVKMLYNGTNIRSGPSTNYDVIARANEGDTFHIEATEGDWYRIALSDNKTGYVAGWIVSATGSAPVVEKPGVNQYLKDKTIVLDPGHGGRDSGAIGISGTLEKTINLRTARMVFDKLNAAGANVVLTRNSDNYVSLRARVSTSHYQDADAFISIHYDSTYDRSVRGISAYYYKNIDAPLASSLQSEIIRSTNFKDRNKRFGNFQVIRENRKPSVLLELGFLSNTTEEYSVNTNSFQENVSNGIYYGLAQYFKGR